MKKLFTTAVFLAFFGVINAQEQTTPGYILTGFYDDISTTQEYGSPGGAGIYWEGDESQHSSVVRHEGYLEATVDQVNGIDWNPLWVSFGKNPNQVPYTIDLSNAAEIKTTITNENDTDFFIEFSFYLEDGTVVQFKSGFDKVSENEMWDYQAQFDLPAHTTKQVVIDLTNGMSGDCFWNNNFDRSCVQEENMSKVVSMTYEIFSSTGGIIDAKFKIHSLKVGEIDGDERELVIDEGELPCEEKITVLSTPGVTEHGIYYTPLDTNFHWWHPVGQSVDYSIDEKQEYTEVKIQKSKGDWSPFGMIFFDTTGKTATLDLSCYSELEIDVSNTGKEDYKLWFGISDSEGNSGTYYYVHGKDSAKWHLERSFVLEAGIDTVLRFNLDNVYSYNSTTKSYKKVNLEKVTGFSIVLGNKKHDPIRYHGPFALESAVLQIKYIKLGRIGEYELTTSNSANEEVFFDIIQEYGCTDPLASNYNADATNNNGSCKYDVLPQEIPGCLVDSALNYNPLANVEDNSCIYEQPVVYDVPPLTFAGFINDDIIVLSKTDVCDIDYSRVIDKIEIKSILEINSNDVEIIWNVYQDSEVSVISSIVNRFRIIDNVLIKLTVSCSNLAINQELILLAKISENDIEILTGNYLEINTDVVSVYPNPTTSSLFISVSGKIDIFNLEGKNIHSSSVNKGEEILLDQFNEGLYLVKITNEFGEFTTSFVKQ